MKTTVLSLMLLVSAALCCYLDGQLTVARSNAKFWHEINDINRAGLDHAIEANVRLSVEISRRQWMYEPPMTWVTNGPIHPYYVGTNVWITNMMDRFTNVLYATNVISTNVIRANPLLLEVVKTNSLLTK